MAYTTRSGRRTKKVNYSDTYNSRRSRSVTPQQIIQENTNQHNDISNDNDTENNQSDQETLVQEPPRKKQKNSNTTSTSISTPSSTTNNRKRRRRRPVRKKKTPTISDDDKKDKENEDPMDIDDEEGDDIMDLSQIDGNNNRNKNKHQNKNKNSKKRNNRNKNKTKKDNSTLPPDLEIDEMDDIPIPSLEDLPSMQEIEALELDEPSPTKKTKKKKKSKAKSRTTKKRKSKNSSSSKQELSSDEDSSDSDSSSSNSSSSDSSSSDDLEVLSVPKPKKKKRVLPSLKPKKKATPKKAKKTKATPEKRRARKRTCTQKVRDRIARARHQRLFMINAKVISDHEREYAVLGSTGNVYTITIGTLNECTCPDFAKGNLCKHVMFIMLKVLRVAHNSEYVYQKALLTTELEEIFAAAPQTLFGVMANAEVRRQYNKAMGDDDDETPGDIEAGEVKRKPLEGDCPVCMDDIDEKEATTWCRGQCGNNVHVQCFKEWKKSAIRAGQEVVCMYCRAPWIDGPQDKVAGQKKSKKGKKGSSSFNEGYMNLASQQGISTTRDTSTYYQSGWRGYGRRASGYGWRSRWY